MWKVKYSFIIPHCNEWYMLDITLDSIYNRCWHRDDFEIIVVDDGTPEQKDLNFIANHLLKNKITLYKKNNLWVSGTRNFWASKAKWEILIFMDAHMYFENDVLDDIWYIYNKYPEVDLLQPIITSMTDKRVSWEIYKMKDASFGNGWAFVDKDQDIYENPHCAGWFTIIKKNVFDKLWWFNNFFRKWWVTDREFPMRAWLHGYQVYFTPKFKVAHYFKQSFTNTKVKTEQVVFNRLIFMMTCFGPKRMNNILQEIKKEIDEKMIVDLFNEIQANDEIMNWIKQQKENFKYDDDWFFDKFKQYYPDWFYW